MCLFTVLSWVMCEVIVPMIWVVSSFIFLCTKLCWTSVIFTSVHCMLHFDSLFFWPMINQQAKGIHAKVLLHEQEFVTLFPENTNKQQKGIFLIWKKSTKNCSKSHYIFFYFAVLFIFSIFSQVHILLRLLNEDCIFLKISKVSLFGCFDEIGT